MAKRAHVPKPEKKLKLFKAFQVSGFLKLFERAKTTPKTVTKPLQDALKNWSKFLNPFLFWKIPKTTPKMESKIMYFVAGGHDRH